MKILVKTLKGSSFELEVNPQDKVGDIKRLIETSQGQAVYPAEQQMLIHQGKVLKDDTTVEENQVAENSFLVIMMSKSNKGSSSSASTTPKQPANQAPSAPTVPAAPTSQAPASPLPSIPASAPAPTATASSVSAVSVSTEVDTYGQAASNLVAGSNLEQTIQQILEMGGGNWDRDTVVHALRAAYNNPERAIEYLYSGVPEVEDPPVARAPASGLPANPASGLPANPAQAPPQPAPAAVPSSGPNANPLNLFPQALPAAPNNLDVVRNNPQFRGLLPLVQANPQILQPLLQELGKQNPQLLQLIQENQAEFLRLINEPAEGGEGSLLEQLATDAMPQTIAVTPEENEAIQRLEAMGFDRDLVLEVFFACNKNEELAANYLLDHMHDFEDEGHDQ